MSNWADWYERRGHIHRKREAARMKRLRKDPDFAANERDKLRARMQRRRAKGTRTPAERSEIARQNSLKRWQADAHG